MSDAASAQFGYRSSGGPARARLWAAGESFAKRRRDAERAEMERREAELRAKMEAKAAREAAILNGARHLAAEDKRRRIAAEFETAFKMVSKGRAARITLEVCEKYRVAPADIRGHRKSADLVRARHEVWWKIRTETGFSFPQIGRIFNRDHSTIQWGVHQHELRIAGGADPAEDTPTTR